MSKPSRDARIAKRRLRSRRGDLSPQEQRHRATQAEINRQLRHWPPRRIAAWSLFALAVVVAVQHIIAHGGFRPIPLNMGWQDLLIGYPMAGLIFIVGLFVLEPRSK